VIKETNWQRVVNLEAGTAMVITDLHGDWDAYQRYRDRFLTLKANGQADYFIINGDLIHHNVPEQDRSLAMVLDVLSLKAKLGPSLIYLLGNHELPHIYNITLQKGEFFYTPSFEAAMGENRARILTFFHSLPFYVRTPAGVSICHSGATAAIKERDGAARLFNFSHQRVLRETAESLTPEIRPSLRQALSKTNRQPYDELVKQYLAVTGPDDPRYDDFLIGALTATSHPDFELLWAAFFTRNELEYGERAYDVILNTLLQALSDNYYPQNLLITGHIDCRGGYKLVAGQQLRLASAKHAQPREAGLYLLLDLAKKGTTADDLIAGLGSVFTR
jgi:hypothetical protein